MHDLHWIAYALSLHSIAYTGADAFPKRRIQMLLFIDSLFIP